MSKVTYQVPSQYYATPQTSWYLSNYVDRNIPRDITDTYVTLDSRYHLRPDLLAYDLYQNTDYWWVFSIVNPDIIIDPISDMKSEINIFLNTEQELSKILGKN